MTEDDAKKKWCPFVRTGLTAGMAVNHHVDNRPDGIGVYQETRCIGTGCMMFKNRYEYPHTGIKFGWYCGLAGSDGYA
jgi:hypothetical protein